MPSSGPNVNFYYGPTSARPSAGSTLVGALFFDSTTHKIERCHETSTAGSYEWELFGSGVDVKTDTGDRANPSEGVLYVNTYDKTVKVYTGGNWVVVATEVATLAKTTTIAASGSTSDSKVPTEAAVRTAIGDAILAIKASATGTSADSGKVPVLNSSGQLPPEYIPHYNLSEYLGTVSSISGTGGLTSLSQAQCGDFAVVTGTDAGTYILTGSANDAYSTAANWIKIEQYTYTLPTASTSVKGGVKVDGSSIQIDEYGVIRSISTPLAWTELPASNS